MPIAENNFYLHYTNLCELVCTSSLCAISLNK